MPKLRLESLDGRVLPDANPVAPPDGPPSQTPVAPTVTDVAVFNLNDAAGTATGVQIILEKAGGEYVVTMYDIASDGLYTGTDSIDSVIYLTATAELDALMAQFGSVGSLNTLLVTETGLANYVAPPGGPGGGVGSIWNPVANWPYPPTPCSR